MDTRMLDLLIAGHCTHDIIVQKDKQFLRLGGPPSYISRLLESLNRTARNKEKESHGQVNYTIISKVGPDFKYFSEFPQKPRLVTRPTTCFVHRYGSSERVMEVKSICEPIFPKDIQLWTSEFKNL